MDRPNSIVEWIPRVFVLFLCGVLVAVMVAVGMAWSRTSREYRVLQEEYAATEARLDELRAQQEAKEAYLREFLNNPEFVERVVRERLGYVRPGETIFRFDTPESDPRRRR